MRREVIVIMKAFRIFGRNVRDGFKSVGRNLSLSIASISCITITLLIISIALIASSNVENMTKLIREDFTIVAFIKLDTKDEDIKTIKKEIESYDNIESVTYQTKKEVANEMKDFIDSIYGITPDDRLFPVSKSYLHHEMDRGVKESGVKRIRVHDLRHSHVSLLINMGFSAVAIANRVGHESEKITYKYAHLFPSIQGEMAEALEEEWREGFYVG